MKITLTNQEVIVLHNQLSILNHSGVKFSYAIARNVAILKPLVQSLKDSVAPSEDFAEFDGERIKLAIEHSKKDEKGKPVIENGNYVVEDSFHKSLEPLKKKYKEAIEGHQKKLEEYNALLNETVEIELYGIKYEWLPESITSKEMSAILPLVEDAPDKDK